MDCGLQRQINLKNAMFFKLVNSLWKSKRIIKDFKPDVVIGTGFASGPLLQVANNCEFHSTRAKFIPRNYHKL
jgi:UDP-N-acetylglucosamine--N-acetylmuramyl-(pentapeptide) pyrophosphoryl-undecaprenol N-acetylglucosamine transferase